MNKNLIIAEYNVVHTEFGDSMVEMSKTDGALPIGYTDINSWIESRKAAAHNNHIRKLVKDMGCDTTLGYIMATHAGSLNDTFRIRNFEFSFSGDENYPAERVKMITSLVQDNIKNILA